MRTFIFSFLLLLFLLVIQATLLALIAPAWRPDLVLLGLVVLSLRFGSVFGVYLGFLTGAVQDVYAVETLGASALAYCLVGYLAGLLDETRFTFSPLTKCLLFAGAYGLHDIVYNLAIGLEAPAFWSHLLWASLPSGIVSVLLSIPVFYLAPHAIRES